MGKHLKTKKSFRVLKIVVIAGMGLVLIGGALTANYVDKQLDKIVPVVINRSPDELGIAPRVEERIKSIDNPPLNIVLFGVDKRPDHEYSNSDVIMVISINKKAREIKIASIMRDTYVNIEGKGMDKINAAFDLGGPQLAIKTINQNFDLNIKDFVSVDIAGMSNVIDELDGIELDITKEELPWLNSYLDEAKKYDSTAIPPYVSKTGRQLLNGKQAVAYTRIRYTSGNDYKRTERQRTVLTLLIRKIKQAGPMNYPFLVSRILPYVQTSIGRSDLLKIGSDVFINNIRTVKQERFPLYSESRGKMINNIWYLVTDITATKNSIHEFIFNKQF